MPPTLAQRCSPRPWRTGPGATGGRAAAAAGCTARSAWSPYWNDTNSAVGLRSSTSSGLAVGKSSSMKFFQPQ